MREDEAWKSLVHSTDGGDTETNTNTNTTNTTNGGHVDEMASLASVIRKLEGLLGTGWGVLGSERRRVRRRRTAGANSSSMPVGECSCRSTMMCKSCPSCQYSSQRTVTIEDELPISPLEWHAALLAYIQLSNQMRERYPSWRDAMYESANDGYDNKEEEIYNETSGYLRNEEEIDKETLDGHCTSCTKQVDLPSDADTIFTSHKNRQDVSVQEITTLQRMLDYAVWAYEPNEQILRQLLHSDNHESENDNDSSGKKQQDTNTGYQLLVHRTTSYIEPSLNDTSTKNNNKKKMRKPPGRVGYYVAISHEKREVLIGMKGTSTLEDILTDCCGRALRLELERDPHHPVVTSYDVDGSDGSGCRESAVDKKDDDETNLVLEYEGDETLQVSFVSHGLDASHLDEIEVNLVDIEVFHHDESIETSMTLQHEGQTNEDANDLLNNTHRSGNNILRKKNGSEVNMSTVSAPDPAENVLLIPVEQASGSATKRSGSKSQSAVLESSHEETLDYHGIEMQPQRTTKVRGVHEGLIHCAQQLFYEISPLIEEFAVSKGYDVICTGHSMGAGTSALLALLIRGKYPELVVPRIRKSDSKTTNEFVLVERVRVYAFASPPVMDRASALACQHYVTSVVNNSDIIPRSSLTNLDVALTMLEAVRHKLVDHGMNPSGSKATKDSGDVFRKPKNFIASIVALFGKLSEGTAGDLLIDPIELQQVWNDAVADACLGEDEILWDEEGDHHLFVPGKVLVLYEPWSSPESHHICNSNSLCDKEDSSCPVKIDPKRQLQQDAVESSFYKMIQTDGTARMLKGLEVGAGGKLVSDHLTTSYYRALDALKSAKHPRCTTHK